MTDLKTYYDDGHWRVSECPDDPMRRLHLNNAHGGESMIPECWTMLSLFALSTAIYHGFMNWEKGAGPIPEAIREAFRR